MLEILVENASTKNRNFCHFSECRFFWRRIRKSLCISKPKMKKKNLAMKRLSKICVNNKRLLFRRKNRFKRVIKT